MSRPALDQAQETPGHGVASPPCFQAMSALERLDLVDRRRRSSSLVEGDPYGCAPLLERRLSQHHYGSGTQTPRGQVFGREQFACAWSLDQLGHGVLIGGLWKHQEWDSCPEALAHAITGGRYPWLLLRDYDHAATLQVEGLPRLIVASDLPKACLLKPGGSFRVGEEVSKEAFGAPVHLG